MSELITRKFFKPMKGKGDLRKSSQHFAEVRYYLQRWQDFASNQGAGSEASGRPTLSGMDGEITLEQSDRKKIGVEELVGQDFVLRTELDAEFEIFVYKVKDNNPARGRYSVRSKFPERSSV